MGKLDQLKKMQSKQQTSAIDLLQNDDDENIFDHPNTEPVITEEKVELEEKPEKEQERVVVVVKDTEKNVETTEEKVEKHLETENETCYVSQNKRYSIQKSKAGVPKKLTIRVPETLYQEINEFCEQNSIAMSLFAKAAIENCIDVDYKSLIWYGNSFATCEAKDSKFAIKAKIKYKVAAETKAIACTIDGELYNQTIAKASEYQDVESLNDLYILYLNTQLVKIKEK